MICAIDALTRASKRQYQEDYILRELNKAYAGFFWPLPNEVEEIVDRAPISDLDTSHEDLDDGMDNTPLEGAPIGTILADFHVTLFI